ncbi:hypothetical protein D9M68_841180 [compost metagenome]
MQRRFLPLHAQHLPRADNQLFDGRQQLRPLPLAQHRKPALVALLCFGIDRAMQDLAFGGQAHRDGPLVLVVAQFFHQASLHEAADDLARVALLDVRLLADFLE